jgi:hypothetical protein
MQTFYKAVSLYEKAPKERLIGFFDQEEDALQAIIKQGINGVGDGKVLKLYSYPSFEDFKTAQINQIVKRAEGKLTEDEKKALQQFWEKGLVRKLTQVFDPQDGTAS